MNRDTLDELVAQVTFLVGDLETERTSDAYQRALHVDNLVDQLRQEAEQATQ